MLGDKHWLTFSIPVDPIGVGWGWGQGSVNASEVLSDQNGKNLSSQSWFVVCRNRNVSFLNCGDMVTYHWMKYNYCYWNDEVVTYIMLCIMYFTSGNIRNPLWMNNCVTTSTIWCHCKRWQPSLWCQKAFFIPKASVGHMRVWGWMTCDLPTQPGHTHFFHPFYCVMTYCVMFYTVLCSGGFGILHKYYY